MDIYRCDMALTAPERLGYKPRNIERRVHGPQPHVNSFDQDRRYPEEMGADRRHRPGRRPARHDHRHAAARQAQAELHPAHGRRRQRHRHQRREDRADRPQARARRSITTTPASSAASRSAPRARSSRASSPSASSRRRCSACCRTGRSAARSSAICASIQGAEHPHAAQQPEKLDIASMNRKNMRAA